MKLIRSILAAASICLAALLPIASSAQEVGFQVLPNGSDITGWSACVYNQLNFPVADYDLQTRLQYTGGVLSGNIWTPVLATESGPAMIHYRGEIWVYADGLGTSPPANPNCTPNYVFKIFRNGACNSLDPKGAAIGVPASNFANSYVITISIDALAEPGDTFTPCFFSSYSGALINGNPQHTHISAYR